MPRIAICSPHIETGDAVGNDVIGMYNALLTNAYDVGLFSVSHKTIKYSVEPVENINNYLRTPNDLFIYHFSIGWSFGLDTLKNLKCRKIVKYHNVTPPEFFDGIDNGYEYICRAGREQIKELIRYDIDLFLADSEYSMNELISFGCERHKCRAVPPFHHINRLTSIEANLKELDRFNDGATNILMVGRVAPNKGHNALIDAYKVYNEYYNPNSRLLIVGAEDPKLSAYTMYLKEKVKGMGLEDRVIFTGKVSDCVLKAYYLTAHVFMITSMHEGFCVPIIEAMSMKIPIVAYSSSAIPYTVGKVGIVWEEYDPELFAASIDRIVRDEQARISLGEAGWLRYKDFFSNDKIKDIFLESIESISI